MINWRGTTTSCSPFDYKNITRIVRNNKNYQKLEKNYLVDTCYNNKSVRNSILESQSQQDKEIFISKVLTDKEIQRIVENSISQNNSKAIAELLSQLFPLLQETVKENIAIEEAISKNMKFLPRRLIRNQGSDKIRH